MWLRIEDGNVVFATHIIKFRLDNIEIKNELISMFQFEKEGIIIYSEDFLELAKSKLDKLGIIFTIEELQWTQEQKDKVMGVKYLSRSEAIKHLTNNKEPSNQIIPNIKVKQNNIGIDLVNKDLEILKLKNQNNIIGQQLVNLELKLLEKGV